MQLNRKVGLLTVALLTTFSLSNAPLNSQASSALGLLNVSATTSSTSASYTVNGTVGPFTILKSSTMIGTGTSTSGFVANAKESDTSAPSIVKGAGTVSNAGTYSGSAVTVKSGSNSGSYAANWGSASSLVTTGAYVVTGLSTGSSFSKTWSNIGTLNGKQLNVSMTFTVTAIQNTSSSNNYVAVSNNLTTFVTSNNINGSFKVAYTYADGAPLPLSDLNQLAFLGGSLTPSTEYMTTPDAQDVLLSSNSSVPTAVKGATNADANSLGLASGLNTLFYSPNNSYTVSDTDFNSYGYAYGASFLNFTSTTPTFYFGNWTAASGKISAQGANHLLFATETSPIEVSRLLTANGDSDYITVTPNQNTTLKNTVTPSEKNDNSIATITKATASVVTGLDGTIYPASDVTVDTAGNVTVDSSIFKTAGNYTLSVTYTDSTGAIATAYDNISVAVGANGLTNIATPVTVKNSSVPSSTPDSVKVTAPDGTPLDSSNVTITSDGNDSLVTLAGQNTPSIYTIDVTYKGTLIEDYVSVAQGDNTTVGLDQTATVQNDVQKITDINTKEGGNVILNPELDLASGTVGTITGPADVPASDVTVNSDGSVSLKGQSVPGTYTIPVTYTETYTDAKNNTVTMSVTVNDVVTVVDNEIPGFEVSTATGTAVTGTNDLSNIDLGLLDAQGPKSESIELISATAHDDAKTPITGVTNNDFTAGTLPSTFGDITADDKLPAGDYVIKVNYVGQDGLPSSTNDLIHVYPAPTISSNNQTIMVSGAFTDKDTFTAGTDSLGNAIDYDTAVANGDLVVNDNVDTSKAGTYSVTYTYTDPVTKAVVTSTAKVTVKDATTILSKASDSIVEGTDFKPGDDFTSSTNADGSDGSLTDTNDTKVAVVITDKAGQVIWSGTADQTVTADKLASGDYTVTYTVMDSNDKVVSSSTTLTVRPKTITTAPTDDSALTSQPSDEISQGQTYQPGTDIIKAQDKDGKELPHSAIPVVINDKSDKTVWTGTANQTVPADKLPAGNYTVTYTVTGASGKSIKSSTALTVTAKVKRPTTSVTKPSAKPSKTATSTNKSATASKTATNSNKQVLPKTGDNSNLLITIVGSLTVFSAVLLEMLKRRKHND